MRVPPKETALEKNLLGGRVHKATAIASTWTIPCSSNTLRDKTRGFPMRQQSCSRQGKKRKRAPALPSSAPRRIPSGHRFRHHPLRAVLVHLHSASVLHCSLCQPVWRVQDDPLRLRAVPTISDTGPKVSVPCPLPTSLLVDLDEMKSLFCLLPDPVMWFCGCVCHRSFVLIRFMDQATMLHLNKKYHMCWCVCCYKGRTNNLTPPSHACKESNQRMNSLATMNTTLWHHARCPVRDL